MKLRLRKGLPEIGSIDLDSLETDKSIKWVETDKEYFVGFEEEDGFLVPKSLSESPKSPLFVKVKFEIIYKSYALADFGLGEGKFEGDFVEVDIKDNSLVLKK